MEDKLFDLRQVLLVVGNYPSYCEKEVFQLIEELGFTPNVKIYGHNAMATKNLYI